MNDKELLQKALDALEMSHELQDIGWVDFEAYKLTCDADILSKLNITIEAIKARLAQPELLSEKSKGALSQEENKRHNEMIIEKFYEENADLYKAQPDCVCGELDSEGVHRKDKPCYIEPEFEQINYEEWRFNPMTGESLYDVQSEPEPVAYVSGDEHFQGIDWNLSVPELPNGTPLYTAPPKKEWVGLTEEEKLISYSMYEQMGSIGFVQAIEAKLKEKNT